MGFRRFFRRRREDAELDQELEAHIGHEVDENIASGMDEVEARRQAYLKLGSSRRVREEVWEWSSFGFFSRVLQDLRYGLRQFRRNPAFSVIAVLCLTLGIGANAAVFSWIEGIALRPFPAVAHQEQLVVVVGTKPPGSRDVSPAGYTDVSWPDWLDFQKNCRLIDSFIGDRIMGATLGLGDRAEDVTGSVVSSNYFKALGVQPVLGRGFEPADDIGRNAHPVVVISYWLWKERYHGDRDIIGKTQVLNGVPHNIIGVAPENFNGTFVGYPMQIWVPASMQETFVSGGYMLEDRGGLWIEGFARVKPGVTLNQAQQEISAVAARLETAYLATNRGRGVKILPLWKAPFNQAGNLMPTLEVALAVVFFVLLIACANVSSLLLVRSLARRHEMTVRLAIGARRGRLVQQLVTEGFILSILATAAGALIAFWCRNLVTVFFPLSSAVATNLAGHLDWRVLAFSGGVGLISTLLFALAPAIQTSKVDLAAALKSDSGGSLGSRGKSRIRSILVLGQVSLSFIVLVVAALFIESQHHIRMADPGFFTQNVLTTAVDLGSAGYDAPRAKTFQDALLERVRSLPGVESAAWARSQPFSYSPPLSAPIAVEGYDAAPDELPTAEFNPVSPGYFTTMGIPLISGRDFTPADNETAPLAAIVNEKMVAQYWHGNNPVGKRLQVRDQWVQVVGVARQAKYSSYGEDPTPFFYVPLRQNFSRSPRLNIQTELDPGTMAAQVTREVRALDAGLTPTEMVTMRENINRTALSSQQIALALLSIFGGLALLLAAIGLYGVMSYAVSLSKREMGLRMALGATASDLLRLVMSHGLYLTAGGLVVGIAVSLGFTRLLGNLLYQVSPRDPLAFVAAFAVMIMAAAIACFFPAWRASRTDPVRELRG